jgi:hypothetical protein
VGEGCGERGSAISFKTPASMEGRGDMVSSPALPGREKVAETVKKGKKKEEDPLTKDESVQAGQRNQTLREGKV